MAEVRKIMAHVFTNGTVSGLRQETCPKIGTQEPQPANGATGWAAVWRTTSVLLG